MKAESRAPVVDDERDVLELELLDEALDIIHMLEETVFEVGLIGAAHTNQIGRDAAAVGTHMWDALRQR
jgi:hypothetical protein